MAKRGSNRARRRPAKPARRAHRWRVLSAISVALLAAALFYGTGPALDLVQLQELAQQTINSLTGSNAVSSATLDAIPSYSGSPYVTIDASSGNPDGTPNFTDEELARAQAGAFEEYSALDALGRCGAALACVGAETMPAEDEERGDISSIHPTGWEQAEYDFVDGGVLYNRCHLIAWALAAENDNERNLITGTRYLNVEGMLPFETQILEYIEQTGNHVLYRVTPIFEGDELVARGVQLEAWSVEDDGAGICFNVYCYNVQPGVEIDYATGKSVAEQ